ncbi:putative chitin deacetylase [Aspergillus nomiae NRRL 13137]|uniref:Putative chitin deacetylase n=1 Tax=Aspergillus nomiae NRRL (strain ATCC 15546 / NRRL 13137 / CBS 260.88 / M93) TaxID=1509407 RepID=A0A0L1IM65_ASPN3|nr:putative chitin deacetylase [Aspergillus nomiae NRRL 13137]KNG80268.1 putative chitin deacetylase [Aspergillus nomiae NRRL 13137]
MYKFFTLSLLMTLTPHALCAPLDNAVATVPTGQVIRRCTTPNTVALTFDDGPSGYTPQLLDLLDEYGAKATFFMVGEGSQEYPDIIRRMRSEGHQVGSHTLDHANLPSLSYEQIVQQMTSLEGVLQSAMGDIPTYMRPPYFEVNEQVLAVMRQLGYKVVESSIDTKDYENDDPTRIDISYEKFVNELNAGGTIVLAHDIHEQTVVNLAQRMLEEISARGFRMTTVGECLGEAEAQWYRRGR